MKGILSSVTPKGHHPRKTQTEIHFQTEHARLIRALLDSKDRETDMLIQIRRMKESLVMSALKLQVANKIIHEDEAVIASLRKDAAEAKKLTVVSVQKEVDAAELVESLRVEISALKRQVREKTDEASQLFSTTAVTLTVCDAEVDQMMSKMSIRAVSQSGTSASTGDMSRSHSRGVTPFQDWKLQQYIWSPDIPIKEEFDAEKVRRANGEGEDPAVVSSILDDTFRNIKTRHTARNKQRPPSTPFGNAMENARASTGDLRAMTASGPLRRAQTAAAQLPTNEMISSKFPGISKIRQRVASSQQVHGGEIEDTSR